MRRVILASVMTSLLLGDEGMWLYTNPPLKQLKDRYGFEPSKAWLERLQKASVRFNNGGSGSFVSAEGLIMTNHHVGTDCLQKLSTAQEDLVKKGFLARTKAEERKCVDLELNVLMSIEDVTARVKAAVKSGLDPAAAQKARQAEMNAIEKESLAKTGLRSDVVTLYNGGEYHLYRYKRYTDVRLVFAPEVGIAFFGGDPDNFEYPRYALDVAFFRAYENGRPAKIEHFLKWNPNGPAENDLIFVSGHPGKTDRLNTMRHLDFLRDRVNPTSLNVLRRREVMLQSFAARSIENERRAQDEILSIQNSRKARTGMLAGLQDPGLMASKRAKEEELRKAIESKPEWKSNYGDAWPQVAKAIETWDRIYVDHYLWERGQAFNSEFFHYARGLLRLAEESKKPNAQRLREYAESRLESLKLELLSEAPIYEDLEILKLTDSLSMLVEWAGETPEVQKILNGKSPGARASELVRGSNLKDAAYRKKLFEGGWAAVSASDDPMIQLARLVDGRARELRTIYDQQVDEPLQQAYAKIAQARLAVFGTALYPDATFTLRLAYGQAKGYEVDGKKVPWATVLGGAFSRAADHKNKPPFDLPQSWKDSKANLDLNTKFVIVSTADITGGNSGSPVVNREGEVVGLIFDGNIESLVLDFAYDDKQARALAVDTAAITEALRKVYKADNILKELMP